MLGAVEMRMRIAMNYTQFSVDAFRQSLGNLLAPPANADNIQVDGFAPGS